jgi:1-hydroxy-2-naphthoate dioxygenase
MTAAEALAEFNRQLADKHLLGFWNAGNIAETYEPKASYEPYIWRWQDVYDGLMKAGELLTLEQTARRFIGFYTPNKFRTTHTLAMGVQLVKPGEIAEAHRHTGSMIYHAFRGGGVTTIGDKDFEWSEGDSFTIPQWQWHKHVNRAKDPAILFVMNDKPVLDALGFYREESENK